MKELKKNLPFITFSICESVSPNPNIRDVLVNRSGFNFFTCSNTDKDCL